MELIANIAGYCVLHARLRQLRLCVKMLETSRTFAACLAYPQDTWPGATEVRRMWRTEEEVKRALKLHMDDKAWRAAWRNKPFRDALLDGCRKVWPVRIKREPGVDWRCERRKFDHTLVVSDIERTLRVGCVAHRNRISTAAREFTSHHRVFLGHLDVVVETRPANFCVS